jgi:hypothetical protein
MIVNFGQFFENYRRSPNLGQRFSTVEVVQYFLQKWGWLHFGQFFTHSSGHPGANCNGNHK